MAFKKINSKFSIFGKKINHAPVQSLGQSESGPVIFGGTTVAHNHTSSGPQHHHVTPPAGGTSPTGPDPWVSGSVTHQPHYPHHERTHNHHPHITPGGGPIHGMGPDPDVIDDEFLEERREHDHLHHQNSAHPMPAGGTLPTPAPFTPLPGGVTHTDPVPTDSHVTHGDPLPRGFTGSSNVTHGDPFPPDSVANGSVTANVPPTASSYSFPSNDPDFSPKPVMGSFANEHHLPDRKEWGWGNGVAVPADPVAGTMAVEHQHHTNPLEKDHPDQTQSST